MLKALEALPGVAGLEGYLFVEERGPWDMEAKRLEKELEKRVKTKPLVRVVGRSSRVQLLRQAPRCAEWMHGAEWQGGAARQEGGRDSQAQAGGGGCTCSQEVRACTILTGTLPCSPAPGLPCSCSCAWR